MADDKAQDPDKGLVPSSHIEEGYVKLPLNEGQFRDFIKSLLGSPQSINKNINGSYQVDVNDVRNIHLILIQRVSQQNNGLLISFVAKIFFSDDSSVELNSIEEFSTYNELRPVKAVGLHITWDFVIRFQDKNVPEKQRIQLSFNTADYIALDDLRSSRYYGDFINFRIEHTARTWGADIESLLTNHLSSLLQKTPRLKKIIRENDEAIGNTVGVFFSWGLLLVAIYFYKD